MDYKALSNPITLTGDNNNSFKPSFFQKIKGTLSNFSPKLQKAAGAGLLVFMLFAIGLGVFLARKPTQLAPQASSIGVDVSLKPETLVLSSIDEGFNVDVFLDPGQTGFKITQAQIKINYDTTKLVLDGVVPNPDYLPTVLQQPQNTAGSTSFTLGSSNTPQASAGVAATLRFRPVHGNYIFTTQVIPDDSQVVITALDHTGNAIGIRTGATILRSGGELGGYPVPSINPNPESSFTLLAPQSVTPGQEFGLKVYSRSDIDNANLWNATIKFPSDLVEVVRFDKTDSFITNWTEEYFNNSTGEISLTGGVTSPGYKTNSTNALMTTVIFKAKTTQLTASFSLIDPSTIYRNSDNKEILQTKRNASTTITTIQPSPSPSLSPSPSPSPSASVQHCTLPSDNSNQCPANYYCKSTCAEEGNSYCQSGYCAPQSSPSPSPISGFCSSNSDCPTGYYCPVITPLPSGIAGDPICMPVASPSPSPSPQAKGDGNNDGKVDLQDLSIMFTKWSPAINIISHFQLDFNDDLRINSLDYGMMRDLLKQLNVIRS